MAVSESLSGVKGTLKLNDGTTATGAIRTVSMSMGTLASNWDSTKTEHLNAIALALEPCLSKSPTELIRTATYTVINDE